MKKSILAFALTVAVIVVAHVHQSALQTVSIISNSSNHNLGSTEVVYGDKDQPQSTFIAKSMW